MHTRKHARTGAYLCGWVDARSRMHVVGAKERGRLAIDRKRRRSGQAAGLCRAQDVQVHGVAGKRRPGMRAMVLEGASSVRPRRAPSTASRRQHAPGALDLAPRAVGQVHKERARTGLPTEHILLQPDDIGVAVLSHIRLAPAYHTTDPSGGQAGRNRSVGWGMEHEKVEDHHGRGRGGMRGATPLAARVRALCRPTQPFPFSLVQRRQGRTTECAGRRR